MRKRARVHSFFGLTSTEVQVIKALPPTSSVSISELSRITHLSRTTVRENVYRLHSRGMIRKVKVQGECVWKRLSSAAMERAIISGAQVLSTYGDQRSLQTKVKQAIHASESINVTIIRGAPQLLEVYVKAYTGERDERVFLTQFASGFKAMREKMSIEHMKKANTIASRHRGILEIIMTPNTKNGYMQLAYTDPSWTENAEQRLVDISIVPEDTFANQKSELLIFRNSVLLTDWHAETGVLIENAELAHMLQSFFHATKRQGDTFDNPGFLTMLSSIVEKTKASPHQGGE